MNYKAIILTVNMLGFANFTMSMERDSSTSANKAVTRAAATKKDVKSLLELSKLAVVENLITADLKKSGSSINLLKKLINDNNTFTDSIYEILLKINKSRTFV